MLDLMYKLSLEVVGINNKFVNKTWVTIMDKTTPLVRIGYGSPVIETIPVGPKHFLAPQCFMMGR